MPGMASPIIFDDLGNPFSRISCAMPTKRPHFFFLIPGRKYFTFRQRHYNRLADTLSGAGDQGYSPLMRACWCFHLLILSVRAPS
jgi:hypothetical protein